HPFNPGDVLHFGADSNTWKVTHKGRGGEFLLYDEYDPRRAILFNADGSVWKTGAAPTAYQYFLNFDATVGDLGNDWMVGGTGKDTIWAGWGNDLSNADDDLRTNDWLNDIPKGS